MDFEPFFEKARLMTIPTAAIAAASEAYATKEIAMAKEEGREPSPKIIKGHAMAAALEAALPHVRWLKQIDPKKAKKAGIFFLLLFFCGWAGYGWGHKDALESSYWFCYPKDSEMHLYRDKPNHESAT
jgi:hypothetical protein